MKLIEIVSQRQWRSKLEGSFKIVQESDLSQETKLEINFALNKVHYLAKQKCAECIRKGFKSSEAKSRSQERPIRPTDYSDGADPGAPFQGKSHEATIKGIPNSYSSSEGLGREGIEVVPNWIESAYSSAEGLGLEAYRNSKARGGIDPIDQWKRVMAQEMMGIVKDHPFLSTQALRERLNSHIERRIHAFVCY